MIGLGSFRWGRITALYIKHSMTQNSARSSCLRVSLVRMILP